MSLLLLFNDTGAPASGDLVELGDTDPELRLALAVTHADGTVSRWGPDEWDVQNVPTGMGFSTSIPGGFKDATITLPRRIDRDYPDLNLYDTVTAYGAGGQVAWEGRVQQLPRSHEDTWSVQVGCVGWAAHLGDDPSFREVYVDRDLGKWQPASVQRQVNLRAASFTPADHAIAQDATTGSPALITAITSPWSTSGLPACEAYYDAGPGVAISSVYGAWNSAIGTGDTNFAWLLRLADDDVQTTTDTSGDLQAAGSGQASATATGTRRYAVAILAYASSAKATDNVQYAVNWTCLAVYGSSGIALHGSLSATEAYGVLASDVIRHAVQAAAPRLSAELTTAGGLIEPTAFVIPQAAFTDATTADDVVARMNAYHLYEWGVYEDREFFFRPPDPARLCWEARVSEGARVDLEGDTADNVYNGVIVRYTDHTGASKSVGPAGAAVDETSGYLLDASPLNPVNAAGIPKRWAELTLSVPATSDAAIQIGRVYLAEKSLPQRAGTIRFAKTARHPTAGKRPAWEVRAGDFVRISDHPADVPRRIISTDYSHDSRTVTCSVGNGSQKLDAILERIGISLTGVA